MSMALYTGVTGLLAHQRRLDVVANNIANVNTIGYRGSRVVFEDLFSTTLQGGTGPQGAFGGTNPMQIGLGVGIGSIDVLHTEGSLLTTGVDSDLAVQGNGMFVLRGANGFSYTRDGSFRLNPEGQLIDPATGQFVQGWVVDDAGNVDTDVPPEDIVIGLGGVARAQATTEALMIGNLESDTAAGTVVNRTVRIYDSLGTIREIALTFTKEATPANTWTWNADFEAASVGSGTLSFNPDGTMPADTIGTINIAAAAMNLNGSEPEDLVVDFNFSDVTQLAVIDESGSDVTVRSQNGFDQGVLESFSVAPNGVINGVYSNGLRRNIGQMALATFSNIAGLSRAGQNGFLETTASGLPQIGIPTTGGRGTIAGGVLENSNVDLGTEFANLIVTQRGFQANSRSITAADTLLQETVNLIR
jgi:flagellar hook protein FlgE